MTSSIEPATDDRWWQLAPVADSSPSGVTESTETVQILDQYFTYPEVVGFTVASVVVLVAAYYLCRAAWRGLRAICFVGLGLARRVGGGFRAAWATPFGKAGFVVLLALTSSASWYGYRELTWTSADCVMAGMGDAHTGAAYKHLIWYCNNQYSGEPVFLRRFDDRYRFARDPISRHN